MSSVAKSLCFQGEGWGAHVAWESLINQFPSLDLVTGDSDLIQKLRPSDSLLPDHSQSKAPFVVCAGFKRILTSQELAARTFINVHYSLLPKYRGLHSTVWAILNGEDRLGLSIHLMNEWIDDGPILAQFDFPGATLTALEAMNQCHDLVKANLGKVVSSYLDGKITPQPQDKSQATWVPKRNLHDCRICFHSTCLEIERFFRALVSPYPQPVILVRKQPFFITSAQVIHRPYTCTPGRVVNIDQEGAWIKLLDGLLLVKELSNGTESFRPQELLTLGMRLKS